jgi:hypothetical protein
MASVFTIKLNGIEKLRADLNKLPAILQKEIGAEIENGGKTFVDLAKKDLASSRRGNDEGILLGSISYLKLDPLNIQVIAGAYHAPFIEFGTKARFRAIPGVDASQFRANGSNKDGKGFYDNILRWVKRKGITGTYSIKTRKRTGRKVDQQIEDEQTAFAIYLSIMRHGISPSPFFFKQMAPVEKQLITRIKTILETLD